MMPRRLLLPLALIALSAPAMADDCAPALRLPSTASGGMFRIHGADLEELYIFPLLAGPGQIVYASCPYFEIEGGGEEGTMCRIGILEMQHDLFRPVIEMDLAGCGAKDWWNADCPSFTAEGFTYGNLEKLAQSIERTRPALCDRIAPEGAVGVPMRLVLGDGLPDGSNTSMEASYRASHYEVFETCDAFRDEALRTSCAIVMEATSGQTGILGVSAFLSKGETFVCAVGDNWSIPACSRIR